MDKVTRLSTYLIHFEEKGEPKRYRTEVLPLTSLMPYRYDKQAHNCEQTCGAAFELLLVTCFQLVLFSDVCFALV